MLDKKYDFNKCEQGKYEKWLEKDYFKCDEKSDKKPFTIVIIINYFACSTNIFSNFCSIIFK